ncbi:ROK family protein [Psychromarinibacter sp. S121]|uniref:ROK family protein n=1 Tax=Psychromarinibacter sp. S121 TaxID=3415127 RepID=UPI003C7C61ED
MTLSLGVDIGGTKIGFCRIGADFTTEEIGKVPTALMRRGTKLFAEDLARLIRATAPPGTTRVGLTLNGVLDGGHVAYSSLMGGPVDFPLEDFLRETLGLPVHVDDDIHAMTLAEAHLGKGGIDRPFAMLNIGTGIGVGYHDANGVLRGVYGAGLISEIEVYVDELGEFRSLDRTVCGRGLREMALQVTGEPMDGVTVFQRAAAGDADAGRIVSIFARHLGDVLKMISRFYHPQVIVLNGSISRAADQYLDAALKRYHAGIESAFRADIAVSALKHAAELGTLVAVSDEVGR